MRRQRQTKLRRQSDLLSLERHAHASQLLAKQKQQSKFRQLLKLMRPKEINHSQCMVQSPKNSCEARFRSHRMNTIQDRNVRGQFKMQNDSQSRRQSSREKRHQTLVKGHSERLQKQWQKKIKRNQVSVQFPQISLVKETLNVELSPLQLSSQKKAQDRVHQPRRKGKLSSVRSVDMKQSIQAKIEVIVSRQPQMSGWTVRQWN